MNLIKCPHCAGKLGNFMYADACPHCGVELVHNRKRTAVAAASRLHETWPARILARVMRIVES